MPPEYCSFGSKDISECKKWLESNHPALFNELYGEKEEKKADENDDQIDSTKKVDEKDEPKKKKNVKFGKSKEEEGVVKVYKQHRGGKKVVSQITGLDYYTKDLKGLASKFGKKFSCGSAIA